MFTGYDDSFIVTWRDGVRVAMDEYEVITVSGSAKHYRDPRLSGLAAASDTARIQEGTFTTAHVPPDHKWCSAGDHYAHKSQFSAAQPSRPTYDGLRPECKDCRNKQKRHLYAEARQSEGREVRAYHRKAS